MAGHTIAHPKMSHRLPLGFDHRAGRVCLPLNPVFTYSLHTKTRPKVEGEEWKGALTQKTKN